MEVILQTKIKMMIVIQVTINTHLYTLPLWQLFCAFLLLFLSFVFVSCFVLIFFFTLLLNTRVRKGCLTFEGMCMELNKALYVTIGAIWSNLKIRYWLPFYSMTDLWREKRIMTIPRGVEFIHNKSRKWSSKLFLLARHKLKYVCLKRSFHCKRHIQTGKVTSQENEFTWGWDGVGVNLILGVVGDSPRRAQSFWETHTKPDNK